METSTTMSMSSPSKPTSTSTSILSTKVQRALQVRTDTPAMANALSSLATLHDNNIDARNVRNAIEEDALHQARLLERELQHLVSKVGTMRDGIKNVLDVAESVGKSLETGVVGVEESSRVANGNSGVGVSGEEQKVMEGMEGMEGGSSIHGPSAEIFEEECQLAAMIADAFQEREEAKKRYNTISEFLEKYDLDENDNLLLERYNFEDIFEGVNGNDRNDARFSSEGGDVKDGLAFLTALQRVTKIRKELSSTFDDESILSGMKGSNNTSSSSNNAASKVGATSAMRMVENLASKQERAFERLYHFLHNHLDLNQAAMAHVPTSSNPASSAYRHQHHPSRTSDDEDGMDETLGHPFVKKALIVLKHVPAYYAHTLELIATSRRSEVTRKFLLALTNGHNGMAPIEMKAHDPVNYVGDMLAFVFRTISVESELAKGLAVSDDDNDDIDTLQSEAVNENEQDNYSTSFMSASDVLNDALSGVARPLKSRISHVIGNLAKRADEDDDINGLNGNGFMEEEEADTARLRLSYLYSICGLIIFYRSAIMKAVDKISSKKVDLDASTTELSKEDNMYMSSSSSSNPPNPLVQCLSECLEDATRAYVTSIKVYCAMLDHLASMANDSQANLCQSVILRICDVRSTSPGFGSDYKTDMVGISKDAYEALSLEYLCDTVVEAILPTCSNIDDVVTIKSALSVAKKNGLSSDSSMKWDVLLTKEEEKLVHAQIARDTNYVLDECGLGAIASALESMKAVYIEGMVLSSHPGLSQKSVENSMKRFYTSLIDLPIPSYDNIKDPVLKKRSRSKIAENVADMYEDIYNTVKSEKGGYEDLSFLVNSPAQIRALISS